MKIKSFSTAKQTEQHMDNIKNGIKTLPAACQTGGQDMERILELNARNRKLPSANNIESIVFKTKENGQ